MQNSMVFCIMSIPIEESIMTVKRKHTVQGIVVAGTSKAEATQLYIAIASGQGHAVLRDEEGRSFVTHASASDMFNPVTGEQDLSVNEDAGREFAAVASASDKTEVEVNYTVCADGCEAHIMSEAADIKFCPSCSTELPELSDQEIEAFAGDEVEELAATEQEEPHVVVAANSPEEARDLFIEALSGTNQVAYQAGNRTFITHASSDFNFEPIEGDEELIQLDSESLDFQAKAADGGEVTAHMYCCANTETCNNVIISSSSDAVVCPSCGSGLLDPNDSDTITALSGDLASLEQELLSAESSDDEDLDEDLDSDDLEEDFDDDFDDDLGEDDMDDDLESESSEEEEEELSSESEEELELDDLTAQAEDDSDDEDDDDEEDEEEDLDDEDDDIDGLDLDSDDADEEDDDSELESESSVIDELDVDLLAAIASEGPLESQKVHVAHCGKVEGEPTWVAFYGKVPVAMCSESSVKARPELHKIFDGAKFGQAVLAAIAADGVEQGLADFNFERINPEINVQQVVEHELMQRAEARVREVEDTFNEERVSFAERYQAALSTAALGINRGVFRDMTNPVAQRLIAALSAAGVNNAADLVNDAFASQSDNYAKQLIGQASNLVGKTLESQNEIAAMVANASAKPLAGMQKQTVESRLADWEVKASDQKPKQQQLESNSAAKPGSGKYSALLNKA